jgi:hypothetical protein
MGRTTWDKFGANDVSISYSRARFKVLKPLFILHREFEIDATEAQWLAGALTSESVFKQRVPAFLAEWVNDNKPGYKHGLLKLAKSIANGDLDGMPEWRFTVAPIPPDALVTRIRAAKNHLFEIRFIVEPARIFHHVGIKGKALKCTLKDLNQETKLARNEFFTALKVIKDAYPKHSALLAEVFPQS